jgi:hypothetical protein
MECAENHKPQGTRGARGIWRFSQNFLIERCVYSDAANEEATGRKKGLSFRAPGFGARNLQYCRWRNADPSPCLR